MPRRDAATDDRAPRWVAASPVRDWMSRDPVVVGAAAPVAVAAELLRARKIRHLPVVDDGGRLVGIVTDRDLRQVMFHPWIQETLGDATLPLRALAVREVMTWGGRQRPRGCRPARGRASHAGAQDRRPARR